MLFFAILTAVVVTGGAVFDCGRDPTLCQASSVCNMAIGQCICDNATTHTGRDCSIVIAEIEQPPCTNTSCQNAGTCTGDGTNSNCHCTEDFTGDQCEIPRYLLDCSGGTNMTLSIVPEGNFVNGVMFIEGRQGDVNCEFTQASPDDPYTITLGHTESSCSDADYNQLQDTYTRKVVILYNSDQVTRRDELVTAVCGDNILTKQTSTVTIGMLNQGLRDKGLGNVPLDSDINFDMTLDGNVINGELSLGDDVTVEVALTEAGSQKYQAFRLEECSATNNLLDTNVDYRSANFVENSCHVPALASVTLQPMTTNSTTGSVTFMFDAFKFSKGDNLLIRCRIKMCEAAANCVPLGCDLTGAGTGLGRRRRRNVDQEKVLGRVLTIRDPLHANGERTWTTVSDTCNVSMEIIGVIIGMSILIFFLLAICTALAIRALFGNKQHVQKDPFSQSHKTQLSHLSFQDRC
ncbi:EGF-like domain-containing protein 2 [Haliotis cracherodii]|uniref:EGF-like domain-containing protein 2 n=1 Tax=Haliotis cracherodii TaxID=6455 RepID=UPI0039ED6792